MGPLSCNIDGSLVGTHGQKCPPPSPQCSLHAQVPFRWQPAREAGVQAEGAQASV